MRFYRDKEKLFYYFFRSYLLISLLLLFLSSLYFVRSLNVIRGEIMDTYNSTLERIKNNFDGRLDELYNISMYNSQNVNVNRVATLNDPFTGSNVMRIIEAQKSLAPYAMFNELIADNFILLPNNGLVISSAYINISGIHHQLHFSHMSYEAWADVFLTDRYNNAVFAGSMNAAQSGVKQEVLFYINPHEITKRLYTQSVIVLKKDVIIRILYDSLPSKEGFLMILDETGTVIAGTEGSASINGGDVGAANGTISYNGVETLYMAKPSANGRWTYVIGQPYSAVMLKANSLIYFFIAIVTFILCSCTSIAYFISKRTAAPIWEAFVRADRQAEVIKQSFYDNLFKGAFVSREALTAQLTESEARLPRGFFAVAACATTRGDLLRGICSEVSDMLLVYERQAEAFVFLVFLSAQDKETAERELRGVVETIKKKADYAAENPLFFAVGGLYSDWMNVSVSYQEALRGIGFKEQEYDLKTVYYHKPALDNSDWIFPLPDAALTGSVLSGNRAQVTDILNRLYNDNIRDRALPLPILRLYISSLWSNVLSIIKTNDVAESAIVEKARQYLEKFDQMTDADRLLLGTEVYGMLADYFESAKKSHNTKLIIEVSRQLTESYGNTGLSLKLLAIESGVSKAYLSSLFKEQTGENFSVCLERIRMEKSRELLIQTALSSQAVGERVGYNSPTAFSRAFKRVNGCSPNEYRALYGNEEKRL